MHKSSYLRMGYLVNYYRSYWENGGAAAKVLDIGSYDQNGTYKDFFQDAKYHYTGLDMSAGPNVSVVPKDAYRWNEIESNVYDLVISGQAFEHIEFPWLTIKEIERVLRPSGICIIIAPNTGVEHKAPKDCYRYFSDGLAALATWAGMYVCHTAVAGIPFVKGTDEWVSEWNDVTLVAQKSPKSRGMISDPFQYEKRYTEKGEIVCRYKNWNAVFSEISKNIDSDKKYVLFGAGVIGEKVLELLGEDNVYCFVDNAERKIGTDIKGKRVISMREFMTINSGYNCLVTSSYTASHEIKKQLADNNINCQILFPEE